MEIIIAAAVCFVAGFTVGILVSALRSRGPEQKAAPVLGSDPRSIYRLAPGAESASLDLADAAVLAERARCLGLATTVKKAQGPGCCDRVAGAIVSGIEQGSQS